MRNQLLFCIPRRHFAYRADSVAKVRGTPGKWLDAVSAIAAMSAQAVVALFGVMLVLFLMSREATASSSIQASAPARALAYLTVKDGVWQVAIARVDGSGAAVITQSMYDKAKVSWFPDGRRLLVAGSNGELAIVETATGAETKVFLPISHSGDAVISPDGASIAFSALNAESPNTNDIWVCDADGRNARRVVSLPALQHEPVWSRDGASLFFVSGSGGQSHDIYKVVLTGAAIEQLTSGTLYHFDLDPASDGTLLFSSNRGGTYDVWERSPSGADRVVVASASFEGSPALTADEASLVFTRVEGGVSNLWIASRDGGDARRVTRGQAGARNPVIWRAPISQRK